MLALHRFQMRRLARSRLRILLAVVSPFDNQKVQAVWPKPVVLLVCGILTEGRSWILNLPSNSLGFVLADAGYDVWLINNRGTSWSRRHQNLTIDQEEFWNFSFHEMAIYDIPAAINFILNKTKQNSLYYIGHSQGASIVEMVELLQGRAEEFVQFLSDKVTQIQNDLDSNLTGSSLSPIIWEEFKLVTPEEVDKASRACDDQNCVTTKTECSIPSVVLPRPYQVIFESDEFKHFDYGNQNKAIYNMTKPPFYKIEDVTVPTAVWSGGNDIIVNPENINHLLPRLTNLVFHKNIPSWQHGDFIWGLDAPKYLYEDIFHLMQNYR
ncbi:lysosomal acid lipase/cholesteryl ester hydrolase-like [Erythrolamprus reginae]|uniref:lysosomal acid lipase/cholesteryl ester hydrolase-like n=1 Tax=Erythrolamprus reginae TaxID=121349 RepID=UPI00396C383D